MNQTAVFLLSVALTLSVSVLAGPPKPPTLGSLPAPAGGPNSAVIQEALANGGRLPPDYFPRPPIANSVAGLSSSCCLRPLGQDGIIMEKQEIDGVRFYIDAGHGGAGLTLAPGTAQRVIGLAEKDGLKKDEPILIVGAGIVGMATAVELLRQGYTNIHIRAEKYGPQTPSNWAAGLWSAVSVVTGESSDEQRLMDTIQRNAFARYTEYAEQGATTGIYTLPIFVLENNPYDLTQPDKSGMKETAEAGIIPAGVEYERLPIEGFKYGGTQYWTYTIDVPTLLGFMKEQIESQIPNEQILTGPQYNYQNVNEISAVAKSLGRGGKPAPVFLCPGIGGRKLLDGIVPNKIIPVKGVLLRQEYPAGMQLSDISYMLFAGWQYFVVQLGQLVYGGTFYEGVSDLSVAGTRADCGTILSQMSGMFNGRQTPMQLEEALKLWEPTIVNQ